jgi:hypothetical protein
MSWEMQCGVRGVEAGETYSEGLSAVKQQRQTMRE